MAKKVAGALKWYCEECDEDISLIIEEDLDADVGGFILTGFHLHMAGEIVELPDLHIAINSMKDFRNFGEVMSEVRKTIEECE